MKIKQSQLKEIIKQVVRESIKSREDDLKSQDEVDESGLTSEEDSQFSDDIDDESTNEQINDHIAELLQAVFYSEKTKNLTNSQKVALVKKIVDQATSSLKENKTKINSPKVNEGHKVQKKSFKTVKDLDNNPKNVADPEVPMS